MAQVGTRIGTAGRACAVGIERPFVSGEPGQTDVVIAPAADDLAVTGQPRRPHAVEQVHSPGDGFEQPFRVSKTHEVAGAPRRAGRPPSPPRTRSGVRGPRRPTGLLSRIRPHRARRCDGRCRNAGRDPRLPGRCRTAPDPPYCEREPSVRPTARCAPRPPPRPRRAPVGRCRRRAPWRCRDPTPLG